MPLILQASDISSDFQGAPLLCAVGNKCASFKFQTRQSGWLEVTPKETGETVSMLEMTIPANVASREAVPKWADRDSLLIKVQPQKLLHELQGADGLLQFAGSSVAVLQRMCASK